MKLRMRIVIPVLLLVAGCSAAPPPGAVASTVPSSSSVVAPQRVDAASAALGQRLDSIMASRQGGFGH